MTKFFDSFVDISERCYRVFSRWLFGGDVTYALLPLLIMGIAAVVSPLPTEHFLGMKEWSFAAIIFFGVGIQKFIHIKVRVQKSVYSYELNTGMQIFVVLLIVAVLVLTCVVLSERGVFSPAALPLLEKGQLVMFILGAFGTFIAAFAENEPQLFSNKFGRSRSSCLAHVKKNLDDACSDLDCALYWVEHADTAKVTPVKDTICDRREHETQAEALTVAVQRAERLISEARLWILPVGQQTHTTEASRTPIS